MHTYPSDCMTSTKLLSVRAHVQVFPSCCLDNLAIALALSSEMEIGVIDREVTFLSEEISGLTKVRALQ